MNRDYNCIIKKDLFGSLLEKLIFRIFKEYEYKPNKNQNLFLLLNQVLGFSENTHIQLIFSEELEAKIDGVFEIIIRFENIDDTYDNIIRILNSFVKLQQKFPKSILHNPLILDLFFQYYGMNITIEPILELTHLILNKMKPIPKLFVLKVCLLLNINF